MPGLLLRRIREPSTWAGLAALAVLLGLDPATVHEAVRAAGAGAALAAVILPERRP